MAVGAQAWAGMLDDDEAFLSTVVDPIVGWLDPYAARRTIDLLRYQEREGIGGALYEVGLYNGKYFALLARSAAVTGDPVAGFDIFAYTSRSAFDAAFAERFDPAALAAVADLRLSLHEVSSLDLDAADMLARLGNRARFVSIDGSHEHDDVLWDLHVAEAMLAAGGVIAADDYLNPICLGVTAAIDRFVAATPTIAPFAYIANKLFLCRPAWADRYRAVVEAAILRDDPVREPKSAHFQANHHAGERQNIEACYGGYRILTVRI